jgi:hypothetical protein
MIPRPNRIKDLTGQVFGRLTVLSVADRTSSGRIRWKCLCSCGNDKVVSGQSLKAGLTKSCGCLNLEVLLKMVVKHGQTRGRKNSPEYSVWARMIARCSNPKNMGITYLTPLKGKSHET